MFDKLDSVYDKLIRLLLVLKTVTILSMFALFFASMFMAKLIKTDFMPQNDQNYLNVYAKMQSGQREEVTREVALEIDTIIRKNIPEIKLINLSYGSEEEASFASMMISTGYNILNMRLRTTDIKER